MKPSRRPRLPSERPSPVRPSLLAACLWVLGAVAPSSMEVRSEGVPLDIPRLQAQLTGDSPQAVAELLAAEAERRPSSPHLQYNAGVAAYAARHWEDALVAFDRVETLGNARLADLSRFQRGNAEYQLGVESLSANLDETISRWRAAIEAYQAVL